VTTPRGAAACLALCLVVAGCGGSGPASTGARRSAAVPADRTTCAHIINPGTSSAKVVACGGPLLVEVQPPAAVQHAGGQQLAQFALGRTVVAQTGCLACHKLGNQGNPGPGPSLTRVGARLSAAGIRRALVDPREPMPSFRHLPAQRLQALVVFLSLLGH
jgi:Cytochrome C oxidase, cbb3-type, subunit III